MMSVERKECGPVTSLALPCGTGGRSGTERLRTSLITAGFGMRVAHEVVAAVPVISHRRQP